MASISTANHWLWNFVVAMVTPVAIATIGWRYFILFAVISFCIPVSVYFFFPETMGQSLEQIDAVFRDNDSPLKIVRASKVMAKGDVEAIMEFEKGKNGTSEVEVVRGSEKEVI